MSKLDVCKKSSLQQFRNCRLLRDHDVVTDDLWVRDGKILNPEKVFFDERVCADVQIDCQGALICPGFIDLQINGAFGVDFSRLPSDGASDVQRVSHGLLSHGVTSYCPTIVTSPPEDYAQLLPQTKKCAGSRLGAGILGVHLEGPFINVEKKGAHRAEHIVSPSKGVDSIVEMYGGSLDDVAIITLAPELPGALEVIPSLTQQGIVVSLGHCMANLQQGELAVKAGASFITHLFNAMLPFHHRDPHIVGLLASSAVPAERGIHYGMIADGIHTHPAALRIAYRTHKAGIVLVTDAVPAMGLPQGLHTFGGQKVEISNKGAYIAGTSTLCGSVATMVESVQFFYKATECSIVEALESATLHPAQVLGITHNKGTLEYGSDADFLMLDHDNLDLLATFIAGERVWEGKGE